MFYLHSKSTNEMLLGDQINWLEWIRNDEGQTEEVEKTSTMADTLTQRLSGFGVHSYIEVKQADLFHLMHTIMGAHSAVLQVDSPLCTGCCVECCNCHPCHLLCVHTQIWQSLSCKEYPAARCSHILVPVPAAACSSRLSRNSIQNYSRHPVCSSGRP